MITMKTNRKNIFQFTRHSVSNNENKSVGNVVAFTLIKELK
jgi:hypothetical protein